VAARRQGRRPGGDHDDQPSRYKLPTLLHVVDALPRTASGKVMKTALRREYR